MGQATSSPDDYLLYRRYDPTAAEEAAANERSQALWRDKLRKPSGKELPPATYRELKLDEIRMSDALRSELALLGASTPSCVCAGEVPKKQARVTNGRFTFSAGSPGRHIAEIFTDHELDDLVTDEDELRAREVPVFDREGRWYGFELMYSEREFYRLAGPGEEFERFMANNNVVRDVVELGKKMTMQIFAFRSPYLLPEGRGFHDHSDGALGMIVLFSESEDEKDEYAEWVELEDDSMTVNEMLGKYLAEPQGYGLIGVRG